MFPQTAEQAGVCRRVSQLGAGIQLFKGNEKEILNSINAILNDSAYKKNATKIAEGFKNCSGAKGAADKIITLCNNYK
jgi:UDP:flavonoid glycosyltransferase YjiC (YdhE family)